MTWVIEDFEDLNLPGPGQSKSRVGRLLEIGAFLDACVFSAAEELENRDGPYVAAFFQLPRPVFSGNQRFIIPGVEEKVEVEFLFTPIRMELDNSNRVRVCLSQGEDNFVANATQVTAYVPMWGKRAQHFERYTRCFSHERMRNDVVVSSGDNWTGAGSMRAEVFEVNICNRIVRELVFSCRHFLKAYSAIRKDDFVTDDWLYNYFVMPYPGRVAWGSPPTSLLKYLFKNFQSFNAKVVDAARLESALPGTFRVRSRFEKQIFAIRDLARTGHHALSMVGGMSLIEWMLRINAPKKMKRSNLVDLIDYFEKSIDSRDISASLHEIRHLRNVVVHLGEYSDFKGTDAHEILELNIDEQVSESDVDNVT